MADSDVTFGSLLNYATKPRTTKFKFLKWIGRGLLKLGLITDNDLIGAISSEGGNTALHFACRNGDAEIVEILLIKSGADPLIKNYVGMDIIDICKKYGPFPSVSRLLEENSFMSRRSLYQLSDFLK